MSAHGGPPDDRRARPPDALEDLIGDDVPEEELERLRRTDALLRSVPAPPATEPRPLAHPALARARPVAAPWGGGRRLAAVALAAALSALFFGLGAWYGDRDGFEERAAIAMEATDDAQGASALIRMGRRDADGNWALRLEVEGLPELPEGGYYVLWLARDGEYGATCGSFAVADGSTEAEWTVSYPLDRFDEWVVTARLPDAEPEEAPWLLRADVGL